MNLRITILLLVLVASGCTRDEFGTRDSGGSISVPTVVEEENEPTAGGPDFSNNAANGNNLSSPDPSVPIGGQGAEEALPAAMQALEALTRATFTDASAGSGNFVFSPLALASTLTVAGLAGDSAMQAAVETRLAQGDLLEVAAGVAALSEVIGGQEGWVSVPTMWVDPTSSMNPAFLSSVAGLVQDIRTVDFSSIDQARQTINNYYRTQTEGVLPSVVGQLGLKAGQKAAFVNAVYFHGAWASPFSVEDTAEGMFRGDGGDVATAFMQVQGDFFVHHAADYGAVVVPYETGYDLVLVKPLDSAARARLERLFSVQFLMEIVNDSQPENVILRMPRVDVEGRLESSLFGGEVAANAERDGAFEGAGLPSSGALIQRAVVSFDEAGTGAPETNDGIGSAIGSEFSLDQPFLFAIRDSATGLVLLAGRVNRL